MMFELEERIRFHVGNAILPDTNGKESDQQPISKKCNVNNWYKQALEKVQKDDADYFRFVESIFVPLSQRINS
jgi:hypothetical protein